MFLTGFRLLALSIWGTFISVYYNLALAEKDTDLIMNAVILMFINDLDEQIFKAILSLTPNWLEKRTQEIEKYVNDNLPDTNLDPFVESVNSEIEVDVPTK